MTLFFGNQDMDAARAGDAWAITRLGNCASFNAETMALYNSVRNRLKSYWVDGCEFVATDDANAVRWVSETLIGEPRHYVIEQVTRTTTTRTLEFDSDGNLATAGVAS